MNQLIIDLKTKANEIQILPMADLHIGEKCCDLELIKSTIKYIKNTPNCFTILNGDLMNNALKTSKSDSYEETMTMAQEQRLLVELFEPIKDKILAISTGNHEFRTILLAGINPLDYVARALGIEDRLVDAQYLLTLKFGKQRNHDNRPNKYIVFGFHGCGGGSTIGGKANAMHELGNICGNADLYLNSHTHQIIEFPDKIMLYNTMTDKPEWHLRQFYNTNSFLSYGGYGERAKYRPTDETPRTILIKAIRTDTGMRMVTDIAHI